MPIITEVCTLKNEAMLSKNKIKLFNSLKLRKYRKKHRLFLAEGEKIVFDLLSSKYICRYLIVEENFDLPSFTLIVPEIIYCKADDIKKISTLKTPPQVIGVFETQYADILTSDIENSLSVFADDIQDPGNLGTIVRTADWFGIKQVICSEQTADIYNPKAVQASMGALAGIRIMYCKAEDFFDRFSGNFPVYGTFMQGENIYTSELTSTGMIVMGNEGSGITELTSTYITRKISIPASTLNKPSAESLNVSSAAAVIFSEFYRRLQFL